MAANDTTRIVIDLEARLRNLERTLRGVAQLRTALEGIAKVKIKVGTQSNGTDKAVTSAQKLAIQQQKLSVQSQELANRQERARQTTERLAQAQTRLATASRAVTASHAQFNQRLAAESQRNERAAEALQRQRSSALIKQFREQEKAATRAANAFRDRFLTLGSVFQQVGQSVSSLGATLSVALTAPLTALGIIATRNAVTLDSLTRGLTAIVGSAQEAGVQLARLTEIAKLPGIGFQEAIQGSIRLQAVGFSAEVAERALRQFANAVALTGGGRDELNRITIQLGQLSSKGKVLSQDLRPIIEAGPAIGRALKEAFGTVNAEDIQALGLTSEQFIGQLLDSLEKLPRAAAGAKNTFENFTDAVFRASSAIGTAILPVLTKLVEFFEPIITGLAQGFASLSPVIQTSIVLFGGLLAAVGPIAFIAGQLVSSVSSLVVAFARLSALGLTPTIKGFQLLSAVMRGNAALTAGQAATTAAAAGGWIALAGAIGAAVAVIAVVGVAFAAYANSQKEAVKVSAEQIAETKAQIDSLQSQIKFLDNLTDGIERTASEQDKLREIYAALNTQAKIRVTGITDEEKRLAALREELNRLLQLRKSEQIQQAANLAASLANTTQQIEAGQQERDAIALRVQANTRLAETIAATGKITAEQSKQLAIQGINAAQAEEAIGALNAENENLIQSQTGLIDTGKSLNGTAEEQSQALKVLAQQTGLSARELLSAAKAMGLFKGNIETALPAIERFIASQERAAKSTDIFTESLKLQNEELEKAGKQADDAAKQRNDIIKSAASLAREASSSFGDALKFLNAFIAANPDLRAAIEKERQLAGKSFEEFVEDALGGRPSGPSRGQSALRNAQQQLAQALTDVTEAEAETRAAIERTATENLLRGNEALYRLQLISYREYLETRAQLTSANLDLEITSTALIAKNARAAQVRLTEEAKRAGLPAGERTKRLAQAATAQEAAIRAETKLVELEGEREQVANDLKVALREASIQQLKDVRQLEIEYGELTGRIQDALNAATDEKFRESLENLGKTQDRLNKQLQAATKERNADQIVELSAALQFNQRQIEAIHNIVQQERATNELAAANKFVENAKERQAELERQIGFEVEFRGLREQDAIQRRLEGERKLADSLRVVRDIVQAQVDALNAQGVKPPQALIDFIRDTKAAIQGLGELSFSEQFRLAEQEFNRLNDERINRIQDVERAVRNRTIAEVEGQIIIRRINGEYTADLEVQLALLQQIAQASGQEGLKQQAEDAGGTVKDVTDQIADLSDQIESAGKDAFRSGFADFLKDLTNRTATAKEALLDLVNSIATRINDVIAENLSQQLFESLFGGAEGSGQGLFTKIRGLFGGESGKGGITDVAGKAVDVSGATAAATALTTGATAASAALVSGGATASATIVTSLTASAASFSASIIAAGAAFAASVAAAGAASGVSQGLGGLGSSLGAATGLFPAVPGGAYRFVEGGYPEAVLTTDPQYATRQVGILRELLQRTKGFGGRVPDLAIGGMVSRETAELNLLNSINRAPSFSPRLSDAALETATGQAVMNLRITNQVSSRDLVAPYLDSEEGVRHVNNIISRSSNSIKRRIG